MLQCFSLVYSYMLGLGLACCDLGLSHGLAGHCHNEASDVGACLWIYRSNGKKAYEFEMSPATHTCGRMPFQIPADKL